MPSKSVSSYPSPLFYPFFIYLCVSVYSKSKDFGSKPRKFCRAISQAMAGGSKASPEVDSTLTDVVLLVKGLLGANHSWLYYSHSLFLSGWS